MIIQMIIIKSDLRVHKIDVPQHSSAYMQSNTNICNTNKLTHTHTNVPASVIFSQWWISHKPVLNLVHSFTNIGNGGSGTACVAAGEAREYLSRFLATLQHGFISGRYLWHLVSCWARIKGKWNVAMKIPFIRTRDNPILPPSLKHIVTTNRRHRTTTKHDPHLRRHRKTSLGQATHAFSPCS